MIENELKILRKVKHPNIVKLVEEYRSEHQFFLIMELLQVLFTVLNFFKCYTNKFFVYHQTMLFVEWGSINCYIK
jgi:hypothetical protein